MADPENVEGAGSGGGLVSSIIKYGLMVVVPATIAIATYVFVLMPMLGDAPEAPATPDDVIPENEVLLDFEEARSTVITDSAGAAAPLLMYKVALACQGPETAALIESKKTRFTAAINRLHRNRTRSELNDPFVQDTMLRQVRQEVNALLERYAPGAGLRVNEAMYTQFQIIDL